MLIVSWYGCRGGDVGCSWYCVWCFCWCFFGRCNGLIGVGWWWYFKWFLVYCCFWIVCWCFGSWSGCWKCWLGWKFYDEKCWGWFVGCGGFVRLLRFWGWWFFLVLRLCCWGWLDCLWCIVWWRKGFGRWCYILFWWLDCYGFFRLGLVVDW